MSETIINKGRRYGWATLTNAISDLDADERERLIEQFRETFDAALKGHLLEEVERLAREALGKSNAPGLGGQPLDNSPMLSPNGQPWVCPLCGNTDARMIKRKLAFTEMKYVVCECQSGEIPGWILVESKYIGQ